MKRTILILTALASLTIATYSARAQESDDDTLSWQQIVEVIINSDDAAKVYMQRFYASLSDTNTAVIQVAAFKPRIVRGGQYLISKEFVSQYGHEGVLRVVVRVDANLWTRTMSEDRYQLFLRTGNLGLPDLTVD